MAFVATAPSAGGSEETLGVVRSLADPDNADAEFGILVRSDLKGAGIGWRLMNKLIAYQRARGTQRLVATVLRDNRPMLEFCERLGFRPAAQQPDPTARSIEMAL